MSECQHVWIYFDTWQPWSGSYQGLECGLCHTTKELPPCEVTEVLG